jgi:uncharacterized membrane protein YsdA (DUF1294 family)
MLPVALLWLLGMGVVTGAVYAWDKTMARRPGARRVPERTLLLLALAGGVLGAWVVFLGMRHKTRHRSFWIVQSAATVLWAGVLLALLAG